MDLIIGGEARRVLSSIFTSDIGSLRGHKLEKKAPSPNSFANSNGQDELGYRS